MNIFCGVVRLSLNSLLWCLWCVMAAPASALPSTSPPAWRSSSSSEICLSPRRSSRLWNGVKSYVIGGSENDQAAWLAQEQAGEVEHQRNPPAIQALQYFDGDAYIAVD